jgi:pyruvate dehydrogenase E1 component alpha subunit
LEKAEKVEMYRRMVLIRKFEEKAGEMYTQGKIGGFLHLYIGQEAVAVGFVSALRSDDYVMGAYREHGQVLARGSDPRRIMAELFGKSTGLSRGKGGSMHMFDIERNFLGGHGIVGGGMPLAAGVGLAINYRETEQVVMCFFGDGAVNEGAFHESLNLVSLWNLPVVYVCENNQYGMGTAVWRASSLPELFRRAQCYDLEVESVDGMDVLACRNAADKAIWRTRQERRPRFIEAVTYRYRGHSVADPGTYRTKEEIGEWQKKDPIEQFRRLLEADGTLSAGDIRRIDEETDGEIAGAVEFADKSEELPPEALYEDVYA